MSYLWDTVAISDLIKTNRNLRVAQLLSDIPVSESWISVITIGEIEKGIWSLPVGRRRRDIEVAMHEIIGAFQPNVMPVTSEIARRWGVTIAVIRASGGELNVSDGLIAATALVHDMTLITRNVRDFERTGVQIFNPWDE